MIRIEKNRLISIVKHTKNDPRARKNLYQDEIDKYIYTFHCDHYNFHIFMKKKMDLLVL